MMDFFRKYGLSVSVALTVFYLSITHSLPAEELTSFKFEGMDKVVHFLMYFGLTLAISHDIYKLGITFSSKKMIIWAFIFPIIYGGIIELIQPYFLRSCEFLDWISDTCGVIIAYFLASKIYRRILDKE